MKEYSFLQEISIGKYKNKNHTFIIHIFEDENGRKFHCHILDLATNGDKFHTCVELLDNRYYWHDGKTDVLNTKHRKDFNDFLRQKYTGDRNFSTLMHTQNINNWQALCLLWNMTNTFAIPIKTIQNPKNIPDYTYIKPNQYRIPRR